MVRRRTSGITGAGVHEEKTGKKTLTRMKVLIIGGNSRLARTFLHYADSPIETRSLVRQDANSLVRGEVIQVRSYSDLPSSAFENMDAVINCVGTTLPPKNGQSLHDVNVTVPLQAAEQAKRAGVKHFVQISSLSVYGEAHFIDSTTPEAPITDYGRSKLDADLALCALREEGFAVTLLRLPVLYGKNAGDKLQLLAKWMAKLGVFIVPSSPPRRSILHLRNAGAILSAILQDPPNGVILAADADIFDLEIMAGVVHQCSGRRVRLVQVPNVVLSPLRLIAKSTYQSLYSSSVVKSSRLIESLPLPVRMEDGLRELLPG